MNSESKPTNPKTKRRFPYVLTIWTVLLVVVIGLANSQLYYISDEYNIGPDLVGLLTVLLSALTVFMWAIWALFIGKFRLLGLMMLVIPVAFFTLYYPNVDGDVHITGFTPRFWSPSVTYAEKEDTVAGIDLSVVSDMDFPQFLGPNRDGKAASVDLATDWDASKPKVLWKQAIGEGWSGFVAVNGFAVTQEQRDDEECVTCYDIPSGKLVWINSQKRRHEDYAAMGKAGPRATPTIAQGKVYTQGATGVLDCIDGSNGELIWTANIPELVSIEQKSSENRRGQAYTEEKSNLAWGRSCSPLVYEDKVIIPAGGPNDGNSPMTTLIAFDKTTGQEIWRGGQRMIAYGSPIIGTILGGPQILLVSESNAVGHDPATGEELWSFERPGTSSADANCSQVTYVSDNRLIFSKGYGAGGELIEIANKDGTFSAKSVHKDPRVMKTKLTSPIIYQGHAYSLSDGFLECVEIATFKRKWKQRGRFGHGQILLVGDKLLVHSESGNLRLVAASPEKYEEFGSFETIDGICWNTLCLYGDLLLVRSQEEAACIQLPLNATESDQQSAAPEQ